MIRKRTGRLIYVVYCRVYRDGIPTVPCKLISACDDDRGTTTRSADPINCTRQKGRGLASVQRVTGAKGCRKAVLFLRHGITKRSLGYNTAVVPNPTITFAERLPGHSARISEPVVGRIRTDGFRWTVTTNCTPNVRVERSRTARKPRSSRGDARNAYGSTNPVRDIPPAVVPITRIYLLVHARVIRLYKIVL